MRDEEDWALTDGQWVEELQVQKGGIIDMRESWPEKPCCCY
jgi:hypothetical protein